MHFAVAFDRMSRSSAAGARPSAVAPPGPREVAQQREVGQPVNDVQPTQAVGHRSRRISSGQQGFRQPGPNTPRHRRILQPQRLRRVEESSQEQTAVVSPAAPHTAEAPVAPMADGQPKRRRLRVVPSDSPREGHSQPSMQSRVPTQDPPGPPPASGPRTPRPTARVSRLLSPTHPGETLSVRRR